jgi:hypothetical protein
MPTSTAARTFITLVIALGLAVLVDAALNGTAIHIVRLASFLLVACVAARLRIKLPALTSNMAVNLPFVLVAVAETGLIEALIVGCVSNFFHCMPRRGRKFRPLQAAFNVGNMALAVGATHLIYDSSLVSAWVGSPSLRLGIATAGFFLVNTAPVAFVIFLTEHKSAFRTWLEISRLSFPYFLASAGVAAVAVTLVSRVEWQALFAILLLMAGVYYSYRYLCSSTPKFQGGASSC